MNQRINQHACLESCLHVTCVTGAWVSLKHHLTSHLLSHLTLSTSSFLSPIRFRKEFKNNIMRMRTRRPEVALSRKGIPRPAGAGIVKRKRRGFRYTMPKKVVRKPGFDAFTVS